jgi:hypothetical protein
VLHYRRHHATRVCFRYAACMQCSLLTLLCCVCFISMLHYKWQSPS